MSTSGSAVRSRLLQSGVLAPALLVLFAVILVPLHVNAYPLVGPVDELQHIDYLYKTPHIVVSGESIGQEALGEEACRGLDADFPVPACGITPYQADKFQEAGLNTAYIHPPTYYAATYVVAQLFTIGNHVESLMTAGRLAGVLWLAAGLLCTYAAGRRLGASPWALFGILGLVASTPAILMPAATVNPDSASLFVGGACLLLMLKWQSRWTGGLWYLVIAGLLAEVIKLQNLVVLVVLALYVLLYWLLGTRVAAASSVAVDPHVPGEHPASLSRSSAAVLALAVPSLLIVGLWSWAIRALAMLPPEEIPMSARFLVDRFPVEGLLVPFGSFLVPLADPYVPEILRGATTGAFVALTTALLLGGIVSAALFGTVTARTRALGIAVGIVGLLGATLLVVLNYIGQHQYIQIPARYALTIVPAMAILTAAQLRGRWAVWAVSAMAVMALLATAAQLLAA